MLTDIHVDFSFLINNSHFLLLVLHRYGSTDIDSFVYKPV